MSDGGRPACSPVAEARFDNGKVFWPRRAARRGAAKAYRQEGCEEGGTRGPSTTMDPRSPAAGPSSSSSSSTTAAAAAAAA
eukprot:CAMPEP_0171923592 /NCGR_PEP_ID=MMETSP0993-20121228/22269_1 /TAXON_ID=483369 /ORGANISM="non described non described, Strain CCMP2098" /LENGTH=80 /DNA_ID=CAMNT_0012561649 /DNA_START=619 /DNA_END=859 /DNA_ORIENTATION=-